MSSEQEELTDLIAELHLQLEETKRQLTDSLTKLDTSQLLNSDLSFQMQVLTQQNQHLTERSQSLLSEITLLRSQVQNPVPSHEVIVSLAQTMKQLLEDNRALLRHLTKPSRLDEILASRKRPELPSEKLP